MFTGIIEKVGTIQKVSQMDGGKELTIQAPFANEVHVDESIAVNGVCLTVVSFDEESFHVQAVDETLRKTNLGLLQEGDPVNLERSLTLDKAVEGHMVQGHVDTTGTIKKIQKEGVDLLITVQFPEEFTDYIVGRGSISIDGISLTIARENGNECTVAIIPYTWEHTNLHSKQEGDPVNLEFDIFGKYIVKYLQKHQGK
ncbi:riboflavin synthase [Rhodohalobacter sp. 614A]|uniref:riboflavin synthase n=1 Tax=Rhodohalobacter sp. 614A TaxID=2908649 RepID=UPI001F36F49A|nr:riboflavin synthase [Rhodohalobacter sp. 614A]